MILSLLLVISFAHAEPEKSAFEQALEQNQAVETEERWVEVNGTRYREVTFEGKKFYVRASERDGEPSRLDCELSNKGASPHRLEASAQIFKRTRVFVQFLQESCVVVGGRAQKIVVIDPRLGFTIPDRPKSLLKNKKIYLSPSGPGFSGEW